MEIKVTKPAFQFLRDEMELQDGDSIKIFVRYGGSGGHIPGFSLGIDKDTFDGDGISTNVEGITFFMNTKDLWYLDNHDLTVKYTRKYDSLVFEVNS